jgi:hypothetical protein
MLYRKSIIPENSYFKVDETLERLYSGERFNSKRKKELDIFIAYKVRRNEKR